jgi:Tfp pilus assembly protein PilF
MTEATFAPHPNGLTSEKIQRRHRERLAIVYIRQSTVQQVEEEAKALYIAALENPDLNRSPEMAAQCYKNLGTSFERLGKEDIAAEHYLEALRLSPSLPEAHNALAHYHHRNGRWQEATVGDTYGCRSHRPDGGKALSGATRGTLFP